MPTLPMTVSLKAQPKALEGKTLGRGHTVWVKNEPVYIPPAIPPDWLAAIKPANPMRLEQVVGQWPGEETDEEVRQALERLS